MSQFMRDCRAFWALVSASNKLRQCPAFWLGLILKSQNITGQMLWLSSSWLWRKQRHCHHRAVSNVNHRSNAGEPLCSYTGGKKNCHHRARKGCRFKWNTMETTSKKRKCSYNKDGETVYNWVKPVKGHSQSFFEVCQSYFSISHGGEHDVKQHSKSESHKKRTTQREMCRSVYAFLLKPKDDCQTDKVTAAEITSVYQTVQHSQSHRSADCGSKRAPIIFPESEIARKMSCGRTKSAAIVTDVLAPVSVESWKSWKHGTKKLFPLSVRYWTPELGLKNKDLWLLQGHWWIIC